ncbi:MAG TPA: DUF3761 domain-containing protein [Pseudonocardia sp.]|nr:DUF3761 domain-containing protein [Pseudonocardia sp.]
MPRTVPPAGPAGTSRGPRNGLGAVTFVVVVLAALLAVFPATAGFGFLLCLLALVPAFAAHRRTRKGTATNRRRAVAAVLMAPVFLVVAMVVGAATAPPRVEPASDATTLADAAPVTPPPAAVAPLVAAPVPMSVVAVPAVEAPSNPAKAAGRTAVTKAAPTKASSTKAPRATAPTSARTDAVVRAAAPAPAPAPAAKPVAKSSKPAPAAAAGSSVACDDDTHYVNAKGNCVLRPVKAASAPDGATAKCNDGTYSSSQAHSGTCSRHGGVAEWL